MHTSDFAYVIEFDQCTYEIAPFSCTEFPIALSKIVVHNWSVYTVNGYVPQSSK